ncbi:Gfo/Idh/MocA family oxidoreductase [Agromyces tropicus]|uniref:Gfo/Idh/MocA family oxidoreductase n=1 Tax=Agromyces tropicus TaxID=555371 RepID=A0ABN2UTR9_9MICO
MTIRIGLIGYGVGGQLFHAPYITASERCELVGIVARSAARVAAARRDHPEVPVFSGMGELIDAGADLVVISTPPETRQALVLEAIGRGVHVVADKPFAPSASAGQELADAAAARGVILNVFHNRRFDTDVVTARSVIASGELGRITRLDLRCDQEDASTLEGGPGGGLLRDMGSHVIDQALDLLGPARAVSAQMDWLELPAGPTDTGFVITVLHRSGAHSHISASKINHLSSRELRVHGELGSYVSDYTDVQFEAVRSGRRPEGARTDWGYETESRWGTLSTSDGTRPIPSLQGDYALFYDRIAAAVEGDGQEPVPALEGVAVLRVLDAARLSAAEDRTVIL